MRIVQITDTHFSPSKTHFTKNWAPLAQWLEETKPDLIIHTGDLAVDGADFDDDLTYCVDLFAELNVPVLCVPGNHDVGHLPSSLQPVNDERLERWRDLVGPDRWVHDQSGWRLIGINSLLIASGHAEEEEQYQWLEEALKGAEGNPVAVFAHKPLFVDSPDEGDSGYWGAAPADRARLLALLTAYNVHLYASGHLHRAWAGKYQNISLIWGPSCGFIVGPMERDLPGERIVGAVVHTLTDHVHSEITELTELRPYLLDDVVHEVYPSSHTSAVENKAEQAEQV